MNLLYSSLVSFYLSLSPTVHAGSAAFLPGEFRIVRTDHQGLWLFDPASGSEAAFDPPLKPFVRGGHALTASATDLFVSSGSKVLVWSRDGREWVEWWAAPEQAAVVDVAYDPHHKRLVVLVDSQDQPPSWWIVAEKGEKGRKVYNRRARGAEQPVFDASGMLYFTLHGDLWKGTIELQDLDGQPVAWLEAQRLWPVARQETSVGTPGGSGAREIVPLPQHLVLELSRYSGSGWGDIVRLPHEDPYENHLPLRWQKLEACGRGSSSALAPDGKHAAIYINHLEKWLNIDVQTGELGLFRK